MTLKTLAALVLTVPLAACGAGQFAKDVGGVATQTAARTVVAPIVATQVPGLAGTRMTDCIIANASAAELVVLASYTGKPVDETATSLVSTILARPATISCATAALQPLASAPAPSAS